MNIEEVVKNKINKIEENIKKASTEPIGFGIYKLEGWSAQIEILKELLNEIAPKNKK